jgi:hypothetical protein
VSNLLLLLHISLANYNASVWSVVNGHLAWTAQNAPGNRGDDLQALKLAELQPYNMLHPNKETAMFSVLGLQGEEKAGRRGMHTIGFVFTQLEIS